MPKVEKIKYYAVRNGKQGSKVYNTLEEAEQDVSGTPRATYKSFRTLSQAEAWLNASSSTLSHTGGNPPGWIPPGVAHSGSASSAPEWIETSYNGYWSLESSPEPEPPVLDTAVVLSDEQRRVLDMVKTGRNVFFTGSAGTGKSVLLREIIKYCGGRPSETLGITAATGIASINIGGTTLHSWAGIGLGKEPAEVLVGKLLGRDKQAKEKEKELRDQGKYVVLPRICHRWRMVKTLVIDEISMIDGALFDKLEYIACYLRGNRRPFGGIQLVLSGDFLQLPPVPDHVKGIPQPSTFAFEARSWARCVGRPVVLHRVFRQKDRDFVDMLNAMRYGRLNPDIIARFQGLSRPVVYGDGIEPLDLFPTRAEADGANIRRLNQLNSPGHSFTAVDSPGYNEGGIPIAPAKMEALLERLVAPKHITLKVGAQVMLIKNLVQGELVNGSVGHVKSFMTAREAVQQNTPVSQTEHVDGDRLGGLEKKIPKMVVERGVHWPLVEFRGGRLLLCIPSTFEVNDPAGRVEAKREQIPLILAWALSIHKSQGQTLERVRVDLRRVFEKGQAYVALSRATSMETLQVLNFDPAKVMAHHRVLEWLRKMTTTDDAGQIDEDG